jgi:hypothetical protein
VQSQDDLDQRVARLEEIVDRAIARARESKTGRMILAMLGLE